MFTKALHATVLSASAVSFAVNDLQINNLDKRVSRLEKQYKKMDALVAPVGHEDLGTETNVIFAGDFLWWYAEESGLPYAVEVETNSSFNTFPKEIEHMKWRFRPGFRLLFGFNTGHDRWNLNMSWAYYTATAQDASTHAIITGDIGTTLLNNPWSGEFSNNTLSNFAYGHWKVNSNIVDLEMNRGFWIGKYTLLEPHFGLRGIRVDTDFTVHNYEQNNQVGEFYDNRTKYSQEQKGIGVLAGLNMGWYINQYFSFYSNTGVSLLFTENEIEKRATLTDVLTDSEESYVAQSKIYATQPIFDLGVGCMVEWWPVREKLHFSTSIGWEVHSFVNYNMLYQIYDSANKGLLSENNGSLSFQGGTLRVALDF